MLCTPPVPPQLVGTYRYELVVSNGKKAEASRIEGTTLEITANGDWQLFFGDSLAGNGHASFTGQKFELDYSERNEFSGKFYPRSKLLGIWILDGERLILCDAVAPRRPAEFASAEGSERFLARLVRVKRKAVR